MLSNKKLSVSQNALYNLIGALVFCFCQWIISSLLVVHLSPDEISVENAGLLQLAISITNIFFAISCYNMRTYQISDTQNKYSYGDYVGIRIITACVAVVLCFGYITIGRVAPLFISNQKVLEYLPKYSWNTIICVMFYMFFKLNETFSDVLHAVDQKNYRMDYICVSYCLRGISTVIVFATTLILFDDVLIAVLAMGIVSLLEVWFYDVRKTRQFGSIKPVFNKKTIFTLLLSCLPAVVSSAAFTAITSIPRQTLANLRNEEALGFYGTIATPLLIVQILATSIFNPMLTELSEFYNNGEIRKFTTRLLKNLVLLAAISAVACGAVALLGDFAVGLVFGEKFVKYTYLMYGIIGCTTMYVISWLCTNTLIIMRRLMVCMIASLVALAVSAALAIPFINLFDMNGVSYSIITAYTIHISVCVAVIYIRLKLKGKQI